LADYTTDMHGSEVFGSHRSEISAGLAIAVDVDEGFAIEAMNSARIFTLASATRSIFA
jgi:hypothetical protein